MSEGKQTYRQLLEELKKLSSEQLDCHVTAEDPWEGECRPAELRICGDNHDSSFMTNFANFIAEFGVSFVGFHRACFCF